MIAVEEKQLRFGLPAECIQDIRAVFERQSVVEKVMLFGSRAIGNYREGSDIDLAVIGKHLTHDDLLSIRTQLDELPYAYTYDVLNYAKITNPDVVAHIDDLGIVFFEKVSKKFIPIWPTATISDIAKKLTSGGTPSTRNANFYGGNVPWLKTQEVNFNRIYDTETRISEEGLANSSAKWIPENSIIVAMYGATAGRIAVNKIPLTTNQACCNIIINDAVANYQFVYYSLLNKYEDLARLATGAAQQNLSVGVIKDVQIALPDLPTQRAIAAILANLDDKIELNLRLNQTLEKLAQTLFSEWFVKFNFPGFDGKLVDGLPKGWRRVTLSEIVEIKHGYAFKGEYFTETETSNILLTPGNFKAGGGFVLNKSKYFSGQVPEDYILSKNDLIVTMTDLSKEGDTLGYPALVPEIPGKKLLHNQRLGKIVLNFNFPIKNFLYYLMRQPIYKNFILGGATGSTVRHTSPKRIQDYEFVLPDGDTLKKFDFLSKNLIEKEQSNFQQNLTLTTLRDTLLPRLMSGQIPVPA